MTHDTSTALTAKDVRFGYAAKAPFLGPVNVVMRGGECWSVLGPNGAGKSTLLRLLAGLLRPTAGAVLWNGCRLDELSPRQRARRISFLPQSLVVEERFTTRDVVLMGRYPHRPWGLFDSARDRSVAEKAMQWTAVAAFADRPLARLSGGERQRVHLAAALAQEPRALILDEPTASLDLRHQLELLELLRRQAREAGTLVVFATHDLNLAASHATHVVLLDRGRIAGCGAPEAILLPEALKNLYGVRLVFAEAHDEGAGETSPERRKWLVPLGPRTESGE